MAAIFFRDRLDTHSAVRLRDVKGKILLAACQQHLLRCEVKITLIPKKQTQSICWVKHS